MTTTKTLDWFLENSKPAPAPAKPEPDQINPQEEVGFTTASEIPRLPLKTRLKSIKRMVWSVQEAMTEEAIREAIRCGEIKRREDATPILREANPALFKMMKERLSTRERDPSKEKMDRRGG